MNFSPGTFQRRSKFFGQKFRQFFRALHLCDIHRFRRQPTLLIIRVSFLLRFRIQRIMTGINSTLWSILWPFEYANEFIKSSSSLPFPFYSNFIETSASKRSYRLKAYATSAAYNSAANRPIGSNSTSSYSPVPELRSAIRLSPTTRFKFISNSIKKSLLRRQLTPFWVSV